MPPQAQALRQKKVSIKKSALCLTGTGASAHGAGSCSAFIPVCIEILRHLRGASALPWTLHAASAPRLKTSIRGGPKGRVFP